MARLTGKNVLFIIPKDYYDEEQLDPLREILKQEEAGVYIASGKMKDAVGMKTESVTPDLLIVDSIEGITGDSYVTGGRGTRQIKGVFHGVILIGGNGARSYLWKDELTRLLIADRHRSGMVVAALGSAIPCLANAGLIDSFDVAATEDKKALKELEKAKVAVSDEPVTSYNRIITASGAEAVESFAELFIEEVAKTPPK